MYKFFALKEYLSLCTSWLFRQPPRPNLFKTHTPNSNALRLLGRRVKRSLFIYMAINFHTTCFCPNFSQNNFFLPTIYNFLSYTLLTLRFGDQICLNLSASRQPIILDKLGNLTGNSSSCHFVITHVYIISCQAPNFQHQGRTAVENAFTQKTSLLPYPLFNGYDNILMI